VPEGRIRPCNEAGPRPSGDFVLYWMIANRRVRWNFGMQRAVGWAAEFGKPLVVLEHLPGGQRWDSDRLHRFALDGMADNARRLARRPVLYHPYVEPRKNSGAGLIESLARYACVIVTDDLPVKPWAAMVQDAADAGGVLVERVDSNGLLPMRAADRAFATAFSLRGFLQKNLRPHLDDFPKADPLARFEGPVLHALPPAVAKKWPAASADLLSGAPDALAVLPIDHLVPVSPVPGGAVAAERRLAEFVAKDLGRYGADRNHPDEDATSRLSPYLHFGHISAHEVVHAVMKHEDWAPGRLGQETRGKRSGWWGMSESAEAFLDELVTWRELGYNMCSRYRSYDRYSSLPDWARETLEEHGGDEREYLYSLPELEAAGTHDELWNAAQRELLRDGRLHNYLRMLWGKKILEWSESPRQALDVMIELNNRYALDGRNPNSYTGIFWTLGRYDRAWGPERTVFGKVRYMSSENTARKVHVKGYLERYGP
jgi:deoxyribodipyrimidine photo-lyase